MIRLPDLLRSLDQHRIVSNEPRADAARLVYEEWGDETLGLPLEIINVAALALAMRPRIVVHEITAGVAGLVAATDVDEYPEEPPRLLSGAWCAVSRRPESPLFGTTSDLGGYWLEGTLYLIGLQYPDGATVAPLLPTWGGGAISGTQPDDPVLGDARNLASWSVQAMRFAVVLGLLLDAERTPVESSGRPQFGKRRRDKSARQVSDWTVRRLYVDRSYQSAHGSGWGEIDRGSRTEATVAVRGHVKRQPCGPGRRDRKWIYVPGYQARRWVAQTPAKIIVARKQS